MSMKGVETGTEDGVDPEEVTPRRVVQPRVHDETAPRRHAYLPQTVPPIDPTVREIERRRSGRDRDQG